MRGDTFERTTLAGVNGFPDFTILPVHSKGVEGKLSMKQGTEAGGVGVLEIGTPLASPTSPLKHPWLTIHTYVPNTA